MRILILLLPAFLSACAVADDAEGTGDETSADEPFLDYSSGQGQATGGIVEGSDDARGVLRAANLATAEELADPKAVGLSARAARALLAYRAGPDGVAGTADDRTIATLAELDAVPWIGARSFTRLLAFARAQGFTVPRACAATAPRGTHTAIVVTPDDGEAPFLGLVAAARGRLDVVVYELSSSHVIDALAAAAARGVHVRVLLDRQVTANPALVTRLAGLGVAAKLSAATFTYTHEKVAIADRRTALVFTGNLDWLSMDHARNYAALDTAWQDVDDLEAVFEADWAGVADGVDCTRLVLAPDDARGRLLAAIASAEHTLDVEALYVTDADIVAALLAAHARGVAVRVLINDPAFGFGTAATGTQLVAAGVAARRSGSLFVHAKVLVVDGAWLYLGSENFSQNSLLDNREAGVLLAPGEADLGRVAAVFEADWAQATSF